MYVQVVESTVCKEDARLLDCARVRLNYFTASFSCRFSVSIPPAYRDKKVEPSSAEKNQNFNGMRRVEARCRSYNILFSSAALALRPTVGPVNHLGSLTTASHPPRCAPIRSSLDP